FRHLLTFDQQELRVNPKTNEWFSSRAFGLRDLIFVMRKDQIDTAAVNVERLAEVLHRHRRAFEVPTRTALAKRRLPARLLLLFRLLPQNEVSRVILFVFIRIDSRAEDIGFKFQTGKFSITRKGTDAIVQRAVAGVGMLSVGQP